MFGLVISVLSVVSTIMLATFVLSNNRRSVLHILLFILASGFAGSIGSNYFTTYLREPEQVLTWIRWTMFFAGLAIPSWYLFILNFPHKYLSIKRQTIIIAGVATIVLMFLARSPWMFSGVTIQSGKISAHPAFGLIIFFTVFALYLLGMIRAFMMKMRSTSGIERVQLQYVLGATVASFSIIIIFNVIAPLVFGASNLVTFTNVAPLLFTSIVSFSIIRHRLLDIRVVVTRSVVYGLLLSLVTFSFVFITFISGQFFGNTPSSRNIIAFAVAILIVFGLDPLKQILSKVTDKVFFKAKIDYQRILRELSETLNFELDLIKLIRELRQTLQQELKIKFAATLLRRTGAMGTEKFGATPELLSLNPNLSVRNDSLLIQYLRQRQHPSLFESLERKIEDTPEAQRGPLVASKEEFERMGAALAAPIFAQGHLIAILVLGPKLSGDSFSNDDLQLIEVLAPQIGSAIQKANLFEEVRQFGESLKVKVEEATSELQERNVSLLTLQKITKDITRTLDFNQAAQEIANSVATELGYLGSILVLIDDDGHTSRARAITETMLTKRALKLLPKPFSELTSDLNDPKYNNYEAQVLRTGQIKISNHISDIVCPPLPRVLADTIQKILSIGSIVVVPITAEQKVIGVIEIGLKKSADQISQQEIDTMQSIADELGIVARNLKLFEQIRQTNDQLQTANKHLQELDRAKSEFVSIASHQLRTPMTGIMGYLSMMTQGDFGKIAPEHQKILTDLLSESQRMIRLINQFLNVSKIEAGKFTYQKTSVQVEDLIRREIEETKKAAGDKDLKLSMALPSTPLPKVMADADKLQDVILNLIDNAIKYTAKGSITVGAEQTDGQIHVWVKDTGIGINSDDAPELFSKFVRGSGIAQIHPDGSGLGLFIAKSIIDSHGGRIWVESAGEGKGSTFQFTIPINPPPEAQPAPLDAAAHVVKPRDDVAKLMSKY